jgi:hypothetical protein
MTESHHCPSCEGRPVFNFFRDRILLFDHGRETIMRRLLSIVAPAAGISGCVAAQPYDSGYGAVPAYEYSPGYYAPHTIGIGGGGGFGGGGGIGVGF